MDAEFIINTAETIREQLVHTTNMNILMSWGINHLVATVKDGMAALKFSVKGRLHQGTVIIAYDEGADYYKIYLSDRTGSRLIASDVCCDEMAIIIDRAVETGDNAAEYEKFCHDEFKKLVHG
jgi:hypothetical protein